jgi:hypothetical protein
MAEDEFLTDSITGGQGGEQKQNSTCGFWKLMASGSLWQILTIGPALRGVVAKDPEVDRWVGESES